MDRNNPTASEIREAEKKAFAKYTEAEGHLLSPILEALLELTKKYGSK